MDKPGLFFRSFLAILFAQFLLQQPITLSAMPPSAAAQAAAELADAVGLAEKVGPVLATAAAVAEGIVAKKLIDSFDQVPPERMPDYGSVTVNDRSLSITTKTEPPKLLGLVENPLVVTAQSTKTHAPGIGSTASEVRISNANGVVKPNEVAISRGGATISTVVATPAPLTVVPSGQTTGAIVGGKPIPSLLPASVSTEYDRSKFYSFVDPTTDRTSFIPLNPPPAVDTGCKIELRVSAQEPSLLSSYRWTYAAIEDRDMRDVKRRDGGKLSANLMDNPSGAIQLLAAHKNTCTKKIYKYMLIGAIEDLSDIFTNPWTLKFYEEKLPQDLETARQILAILYQEAGSVAYPDKVPSVIPAALPANATPAQKATITPPLPVAPASEEKAKVEPAIAAIAPMPPPEDPEKGPKEPKQDEKSTKKSVTDILEGAKPGRKTNGKSRQFEKTGGYKQALDDFNNMDITEVRDIPKVNGKIGKLPDGRIVNVRLDSTAHKPTLEIFNGKYSIKIRYHDTAIEDLAVERTLHLSTSLPANGTFAQQPTVTTTPSKPSPSSTSRIQADNDFVQAQRKVDGLLSSFCGDGKRDAKLSDQASASSTDGSAQAAEVRDDARFFENFSAALGAVNTCAQNTFLPEEKKREVRVLQQQLEHTVLDYVKKILPGDWDTVSVKTAWIEQPLPSVLGREYALSEVADACTILSDNNNRLQALSVSIEAVKSYNHDAPAEAKTVTKPLESKLTSAAEAYKKKLFTGIANFVATYPPYQLPDSLLRKIQPTLNWALKSRVAPDLFKSAERMHDFLRQLNGYSRDVQKKLDAVVLLPVVSEHVEKVVPKHEHVKKVVPKHVKKPREEEREEDKIIQGTGDNTGNGNGKGDGKKGDDKKSGATVTGTDEGTIPGNGNGEGDDKKSDDKKGGSTVTGTDEGTIPGNGNGVTEDVVGQTTITNTPGDSGTGNGEKVTSETSKNGDGEKIDEKPSFWAQGKEIAVDLGSAILTGIGKVAQEVGPIIVRSTLEVVSQRFIENLFNGPEQSDYYSRSNGWRGSQLSSGHYSYSHYSVGSGPLFSGIKLPEVGIPACDEQLVDSGSLADSSKVSITGIFSKKTLPSGYPLNLRSTISQYSFEPPIATVTSKGGSLVQELTFERKLENIAIQAQNCAQRCGDAHPLVGLDATIVTNLNELALKHEQSAKHGHTKVVGELSALVTKSCLLYEKMVKAGGILVQEGDRWADRTVKVVDKGFTDPLGLAAEMAETTTKVGITASKTVLKLLGDQEGLADELKLKLDALAEQAQHMTKQELFRAIVATGYNMLGLVLVPEVVGVAGAASSLSAETRALTTALSNLKTAIQGQAELVATMDPVQIGTVAPLVKACQELPEVVGVAVKEGVEVTTKALAVVGGNPQIVARGESLTGAVEKVMEATWSMPEKGKIINGRHFTQHALERMAPDTIQVRAILEDRALKAGIKRNSPDFFKYVDPRGIPPMLVEDAIQNGQRLPGKCKGTLEFDTDSIKVIINEASGSVVTILPK